MSTPPLTSSQCHYLQQCRGCARRTPAPQRPAQSPAAGPPAAPLGSVDEGGELLTLAGIHSSELSMGFHSNPLHFHVVLVRWAGWGWRHCAVGSVVGAVSAVGVVSVLAVSLVHFAGLVSRDRCAGVWRCVCGEWGCV